MQAARLHVEALLRARRLDRTVTDAGMAPEPIRTASTGLPWLDARLAGGWPCGETSEIVGPVSSGRTGVLTAALALCLGGPAAFFMARTPFFGKTAALGFILTPLILPRIIIAVALSPSAVPHSTGGPMERLVPGSPHRASHGR